MGDVVRNARRSARLSQIALLAILVTALALGCSSSPRPQSPPADTPAAQAEVAQPATPASPPLTTIESVDLREGAPGMMVDLAASGPLVWTSYRDASGNLVVELPNSRPEAQITGTRAGEGLVTSLTVEEDASGSRPLTRVTVVTAREVEHSLAAEGNLLRLELLPVAEEPEVALSYEPLPEEEPVAAEPEVPQPVAAEPEAPRPAPSLADLGTAESPRTAPPPTGPAATRLRGVEILGDGTILVAGDGEFAYSSFRLEEPERFVIDLEGVINTSQISTLPVGSEPLQRVRMAQFKPLPEPVSRVVFDLDEPARPIVERTSEGLMVRFVSVLAQAPPEEEVRVAEQPPAAVPEVPAEEPMIAEVPAEEPMIAEEAAEEPMIAEEQAFEEVAEPMAAPQEEERVAAVEEPPVVSVPERTPPTGPQATRLAPQASDVDLYAGDEQEEPPLTEPGPQTFTTRVFGARTIGGAERTYYGEPITMTLRDADVVETLRSFSAISDLSIVVQPDVTGSVTVELDNVPWDQALEQILRINGLGYELEGTVMRIAPVEVLRKEAEEQQLLDSVKKLQVPLKTVMRRLSYAEATEVAVLLQTRGGLLSARGSVLVDRRTNTLIIKELPDYMDTVIAIISEIDTPEPQVMIEARIIETTKRFTRSLGVDWSVSGEASARYGNTTGLVFPNNVAGSGGVNLVTGAANGFLGLSLGNVLNSFNLDIALQAAETEGLIKILSAPKVAVLNNQAANIQSGLQIPVQTIANNTVTVQFVNATLSLDVTPHVTAEGTVLMDISIRKREPQLAFAVVGAANAPIATKEARTRVIVRDGGTTVIGGIYEISSDQGEDRVPGLANIPIIGHLFKNRRRTDENEELLIFITPRVINL